MADDPRPSDDPGVPPGIAAAWGLRRPARRGPRPALSVDRIVQAAMRVAAAEGLGALSMGRVASELDASPMALYRHVSGKEELLTLMADAAVGAPPAAVAGAGWRAETAAWARAYFEVMGRSPWLLGIPISGPPATPNQLGWMERGLAALGETRLPAAEKLSVVLLVTGYVRSSAQLAADLSSAGAEIMPAWGRLVGRLADPADFPALHEILASPAARRDDDFEDELAFGLERILDGVAVLVEARA